MVSRRSARIAALGIDLGLWAAIILAVIIL